MWVKFKVFNSVVNVWPGKSWEEKGKSWMVIGGVERTREAYLQTLQGMNEVLREASMVAYRNIYM